MRIVMLTVDQIVGRVVIQWVLVKNVIEVVSLQTVSAGDALLVVVMPD